MTIFAKDVVCIDEVRVVATVDRPFARTADDGRHTLSITRLVSYPKK